MFDLYYPKEVIMCNESSKKGTENDTDLSLDEDGNLTVASGIEALIRGAAKHIEFAHKILPPVDPESERIIDELVAKKRKGVKTRPLTRRKKDK